MKVRMGWNTEYARKKFDVEIDEDDIRRILIEAGMPAEWSGRLTLTEAFKLQYAEVQAYAKLTLAQHEPNMKEQLVPEVREHRAARDLALSHIKERLQDA